MMFVWFVFFIAVEVSYFLDENHILNNRQIRFRHGKSTSDLMLRLSYESQKSIDKGEATIVIALDLSGAFDCEWHKGLARKLQSSGIEGDLSRVIID